MRPKRYIMVMELERNFSKMIIVIAENQAIAFLRCAEYCIKYGYFPSSIKASYSPEEDIPTIY